MTNIEAATEFVENFCAGNYAALEPLLADDFRFSGPFFQFASAREYLETLRADTPEPGGCKVLSITENDDSVAVFYDFQNPDRTLTIAQLFQFKNGKICETLVVFDGRGFS